MSFHYLFNACAAFEKRAGLTFDLDNAKAKAAELITDMSVHEACQILGVPSDLTFLDNDELMFAFKVALMNLQASPDYGFSKRLMNMQHSIVMAFAILEPIAEKNSEESYAFQGDDALQEDALQKKVIMPLEDPLQEKVIMPLEATIAQFKSRY